MLHLSPDLCYPPCNPVTKTMRSFVTRKPTVLGPLSADLIRVRKPDRPPCREVVNRDHGGGHVDRSVCFVCRPHGRRRSFFLGGRQVYHHPKSNTIPSHRVILGLWPPSGLGRRRSQQEHGETGSARDDVGSARVEENQDGLAGLELHHGPRCPDLASLEALHRAAQSRPANKLGSPFPASQRPISGLGGPGWTL